MLTDETLTLEETAKYLRVSRRTMSKLANAKKVPGWKITGGIWRFSKRAIDQRLGIRNGKEA